MKKKIKNKPISIPNGATSLQSMIKRAFTKGEKRHKAFETTGDGMCMKCKKEPADQSSSIDPLACVKCNSEIEDLLKQLRGPGFMEFHIERK